MGTFSIWHWIVVLIIVAIVFGTKRLRNLGADLGTAIKGFKEGIRESENEKITPQSITTDKITEIELLKEASSNTMQESVEGEHNSLVKAPTHIAAAKDLVESNEFQPTSINNQKSDNKVKEKTGAKT